VVLDGGCNYTTFEKVYPILIRQDRFILIKLLALIYYRQTSFFSFKLLKKKLGIMGEKKMKAKRKNLPGIKLGKTLYRFSYLNYLFRALKNLLFSASHKLYFC